MRLPSSLAIWRRFSLIYFADHVSEYVQYQLRPITKLYWVSWSDEWVVFDETSGQTHQLDAVRAFVLHLLSESSQRSSRLAVELSQSLAVSTSVARDVMLLVIRELEVAGLVETVRL